MCCDGIIRPGNNIFGMKIAHRWARGQFLRAASFVECLQDEFFFRVSWDILCAWTSCRIFGIGHLWHCDGFLWCAYVQCECVWMFLNRIHRNAAHLCLGVLFCNWKDVFLLWKSLDTWHKKISLCLCELHLCVCWHQPYFWISYHKYHMAPSFDQNAHFVCALVDVYFAKISFHKPHNWMAFLLYVL